MSASFYEAHRGPALTRHAVPYGDGELTAMRWEADPAARAQTPAGTPTTLIMMNGFDGYVEGIVDFASHFPTRPFDIIAFDGPGQGHTVLAGMPLEPQWERPTNAVMDYFGIESAAALGVSFGGYLVMRAAAYCPHISHVIAFDMMYRLLDGLTAPLPRPLRPIADAVVASPRPAWLIDAALRTASRLNADLSWKLRQASHLTGLSRPSELLRAFGDYTMEPSRAGSPSRAWSWLGTRTSTCPSSAWATCAGPWKTRRPWTCAHSATRRTRTWRSTARSGTWTARSRSWATGCRQHQ